MQGKYSCQFAIDCKWRKGFNNGIIKWADDYQIKNYQRFQISHNITVYIAIGIGGHPSDPEKLFLTPLDMIQDKIELAEEDLLPYNRKKNKGFFYDAKQMKLF